MPAHPRSRHRVEAARLQGCPVPAAQAAPHRFHAPRGEEQKKAPSVPRKGAGSPRVPPEGRDVLFHPASPYDSRGKLQRLRKADRAAASDTAPARFGSEPPRRFSVGWVASIGVPAPRRRGSAGPDPPAPGNEQRAALARVDVPRPEGTQHPRGSAPSLAIGRGDAKVSSGQGEREIS